MGEGNEKKKSVSFTICESMKKFHLKKIFVSLKILHCLQTVNH